MYIPIHPSHWTHSNLVPPMSGDKGETLLEGYVFFFKDKLVETCGLSITKWNGIKFVNFDPSDKYSTSTGLDG